ncbi:MAG TPA: metalloregulator ArsR/SmtB family transcription factor [Ktedonobacterales bacterium]
MIDTSSDQQDIGPVFGALADPTRRWLLDTLADEGHASASTLAERLPVSRQAVIKHLHVLEDAGLVTRGRAGREVLFQVRPDSLDASARWLADRAAAWDRRLAALKRAAEMPAPQIRSDNPTSIANNK